MRIVKLIAWIFVLYMLQTVFGRLIGIGWVVPELVAAFAVIFSFFAASDSETGYVTVACAVLTGSCTGHSFPAAVLIVGCAALAARAASSRFKRVPKLIRAVLISFLTAAVLAAAEYYIAFRIMDMHALLHSVLPYSLYTLAAACLMYPIIIKTLIKKTEKKLLVV